MSLHSVLGSVLLLFSCSIFLILCDPMDCSTPGFPVLHCLPEFAQTRVDGAIQQCHPWTPCRPLLLLSSVFPSIRSFPMSQLFDQMAKVLELQLQHQCNE